MDWRTSDRRECSLKDPYGHIRSDKDKDEANGLLENARSEGMTAFNLVLSLGSEDSSERDCYNLRVTA